MPCSISLGFLNQDKHKSETTHTAFWKTLVLLHVILWTNQ